MSLYLRAAIKSVGCRPAAVSICWNSSMQLLHSALPHHVPRICVHARSTSLLWPKRELHDFACSAMPPDQPPGNSMSDGTGVAVVYVTVPDIAAGQKISRMLVESKLAACVNIVPGLTSVYWWEGKVNEDSELLLMIKTQVALLHDVTRAVKAHHPYQEPEVIALPIVGGSTTYLDWIRSSCQPTKEA